jgi:hypothetical protein
MTVHTEPENVGLAIELNRHPNIRKTLEFSYLGMSK